MISWMNTSIRLLLLFLFHRKEEKMFVRFGDRLIRSKGYSVSLAEMSSSMQVLYQRLNVPTYYCIVVLDTLNFSLHYAATEFDEGMYGTTAEGLIVKLPYQPPTYSGRVYAFRVYMKSKPYALPFISRDGSMFRPPLTEEIGELYKEITIEGLYQVSEGSLSSMNTPNYLFYEKLGGGKSGNVYRGIQKATNANVILKVFKRIALAPGEISKGEKEARIMRLIPPHDNIIALLDFFQLDDKSWVLVMEYFRNTMDLEEYILYQTRNTRVSAGVEIMIPISAAVRHLHSNGIAHADIKPANILMKGHKPYLIDYDLSCLQIHDKMPADQLVRNSHILCTGNRGTPLFSDPNLVLSKTATRTSFDYLAGDIYSLGATFYFIVARGRVPRDAEDLSAFRKKLRGPIDSFTSGNILLDQLIHAMLQTPTGFRPNITVVHNELEAIMREL